jgi:hypothetical protein
MLTCITCEKNLFSYQTKYCSNACQKDHEYLGFIQKWKRGTVNGSRGINAKNLSGHVIRYLFEKYNGACSICRWNEVNLATGKSPLEIDHIDGNSENNTESNLRLLCPNCHALTINYKNLNYGNGRVWRREKYVKITRLPL